MGLKRLSERANELVVIKVAIEQRMCVKNAFCLLAKTFAAQTKTFLCTYSLLFRISHLDPVQWQLLKLWLKRGFSLALSLSQS